MAKHRAPRYVRTKKALSRVPVAAGATAVGLGVLSSPAQAGTAAPAAAPVTVAEQPSTAPGGEYTVARGDTVAKIAAAHGQSWRDLYERNVGIIGGNPDLITPGQVLVVSGTEQAAPAPAAPAPSAGSAAPVAALTGTALAKITNSAGGVQPHAQAAANTVVANVPGVAGITIGGTRASATDPKGHPSGRALDYMVMSNAALGQAIAQYHVANWDALGVEYVIWQQKILTSPGGAWKAMENRGSATANHMDHVHVNYRG
ncbi:LysM peptidoglycan-binding domain-containing protein [Geodermatophilus ruber]|uniref:LysM domain-containing protein n=1 Tax=Geodermatophilus ruber TaxID=504800 RepID=A0A1I4ITX6_9ACTN|nr:LysM domain-containing protein [Geodermatophilus ruber]SFL57765.1 LysM domain-containing protein [Geodermatophilus ruber]